MWSLLWELSRAKRLRAHADHSSDNKLLFWQQAGHLRNDRAKEGMIITIIIIVVVSVIWGAGAPESCGSLWFIRTCSCSQSHIPQHVKLFVSGCVRLEKGTCGSQQPHWSEIEGRAVWHTVNHSTTCQSTHCYHPALKAHHWETADNYRMDTVALTGGVKHSAVFDPQGRLYNWSAVVSGSCPSEESSPPGCRVTGQEADEIQIGVVFPLRNILQQQLGVINTSHEWRR